MNEAGITFSPRVTHNRAGPLQSLLLARSDSRLHVIGLGKSASWKDSSVLTARVPPLGWVFLLTSAACWTRPGHVFAGGGLRELSFLTSRSNFCLSRSTAHDGIWGRAPAMAIGCCSMLRKNLQSEFAPRAVKKEKEKCLRKQDWKHNIELLNQQLRKRNNYRFFSLLCLASRI